VMANMPFGKAPLQILTDSTSPIGSSSKFSVMRMHCGSSRPEELETTSQFPEENEAHLPRLVLNLHKEMFHLSWRPPVGFHGLCSRFSAAEE
jgi:hypothetical protein